MNSPIKYYGGKSYMSDIIISHFPKDYSVYIEGFGGGASVLFAKERDKLEIYNDLGKNVYSLFKVLSDKELFEQMKEKLDLTYYSAEIRKEFIEDLKRNDLSLVDRAYKYFYVNRSSFNGVGGFSTTLLVRRNMSKSVSDYLSAIDGLSEVHNRLSSVIIENRNIFDLIEKYDDKDVFFYCFDKETEILTKDGWKNIGDCTLNDYCLSREPNTNKLEYVKIINTISYKYKGDMYEYDGKNLNFCVTPNHKMFIHNLKSENDEFITCENLYNTLNKRQYRIPSSEGLWFNDDNFEFEYNGLIYDKRYFSYLIGIFCTDGTHLKNGTIAISQTKKHIFVKIIDILNKLNIRYSVYGKINKKIYIHSKCAKYFRQFGKKETRKIPNEIKNWNNECLKYLLEGIIDGDSDSEGRRIWIGSKTLVDDIQEICYKVGFSSCYSICKPKDKILKKENRTIHGKKVYYCVSINHKKQLMIKDCNFNKKQYNDFVNCVTLEKWHTVLVRRNGKCMWCGQCDPPYIHDTRSSGTEYECEMSNEEHEKLIDIMLNSKGKFLVSGYEHPIYSKLVDNGWNLYKYDSVNACSDRTECLWYNYDIEEGDLFNEI